MVDGTTFIGLNASVGPVYYNLDLDGAYLGANSNGVKIYSHAAAFTVKPEYAGRFSMVTAATATNVTVPANLPVGFNYSIMQRGAGQVTIVPAVGATILNRQSFTKTAGQYSVITLIVVANVGGAAAQVALLGDGA